MFMMVDVIVGCVVSSVVNCFLKLVGVVLVVLVGMFGFYCVRKVWLVVLVVILWVGVGLGIYRFIWVGLVEVVWNLFI